MVTPAAGGLAALQCSCSSIVAVPELSSHDAVSELEDMQECSPADRRLGLAGD